MPSHRALETLAVLSVACLALAACKPEAPPQAATSASAAATTTSAVPATGSIAPPLHDEISSDATRVVGISYPQGLAQYPALQASMRDYAQAQRRQLDDALNALGGEKPRVPYELSLQFSKALDTPRFVVVTASGTLYTGGAHGIPLLQEFVFSPQQNRLIAADALIAAPGWKAVSDSVRAQLRARAVQRANELIAIAPAPAGSNTPAAQDAGEANAAARADYLNGVNRMIDDGTAPKPENFAMFVPVLDGSGRVSALRFVFPPYQVASYADGVQSADVPIGVVRPFIVPEYAALFGD